MQPHRWLIQPYTKVINYNQFCQTMDDFHRVYGLSLKGINLPNLNDKVITDVDWLSVFKVMRVRGKVKIEHVRPELYDRCTTLHRKVFQVLLNNNELSHCPLQGLAHYENCTTVIKFDYAL